MDFIIIKSLVVSLYISPLISNNEYKDRWTIKIFFFILLTILTSGFTGSYE